DSASARPHDTRHVKQRDCSQPLVPRRLRQRRRAKNTTECRLMKSIPWAPLPAAIGMFPAVITPKATFDVAEPDWDKTNGTGPYYLDRWAKKSELVFKRNPYYWQPGKPYLDEITLKIIPDDNGRLLQIQGGQIDVMTDLPLNQVDILGMN